MKAHGFDRLVSISFFGLLASCSVPVHQTQMSTDAKSEIVVQADTGEDVVRHLTNRYNDTSANCGSYSKPAFLCSGVLIRGTSSNPSYHVWENSAASIAKGGVSASYIRADSKFDRLAFSYTNGYIMTAYDFAAGKIHPEVLCFFASDAATDRRDNKGCGTYPGYTGSGPCHLQGVVTADEWWAHYDANASERRLKQCGFDVSDGRNSLAGPAFMAGIGGMRLMGSESFTVPNEVVLTAWGAGLGKSLPLEAFFYLEGGSGLAVAQRNQRDLEVTDGIRIPVISVKLPQTSGQAASFYFRDADQSKAGPNLGETGPASL